MWVPPFFGKNYFIFFKLLFACTKTDNQLQEEVEQSKYVDNNFRQRKVKQLIKYHSIVNQISTYLHASNHDSNNADDIDFDDMV
jgi:hypothetical protein